MGNPEKMVEQIKQEVAGGTRFGLQQADRFCSAILQVMQTAKKNLLGEYELVCEPFSNRYIVQVKQIGWFNFVSLRRSGYLNLGKVGGAR